MPEPKKKSRTSVIIDTETSGLPSVRFANPENQLEAYDTSRIVQIAWVISKDGTSLLEKCYIIKPEGFLVSKEAAKINGITTERAETEGHPFDIILTEFINDIKQAKVRHLVAHNLEFDRNVIISEFMRRAGHTENKKLFCNLKQICTMECGREYAKIPLPSNPKKFKAPKLGELYKALTGKNMREKHDALYDARKCGICYDTMRAQLSSTTTKKDN
tara:strand:+ start:1386 stop:2036 length:651 start_codon:yes stop_codon:yes gene_type:complete